VEKGDSPLSADAAKVQHKGRFDVYEPSGSRPGSAEGEAVVRKGRFEVVHGASTSSLEEEALAGKAEKLDVADK
jgi:hypothetical protein